MAENIKLKILRTIDKANHRSLEELYQLFTDGLKDESGAWIEGCGLLPSEALKLLAFLDSPKEYIEILYGKEVSFLTSIKSKYKRGYLLALSEYYKNIEEEIFKENLIGS